MTGEMVKPEKADEIRDVEYWKKVGGLGDEGVLIYPNYPECFDMTDKIKEIFSDASVEPFDKYQGPYISIPKIGQVFISSIGAVNGEKWHLSSPFRGGTTSFDDAGLLSKLREMDEQRKKYKQYMESGLKYGSLNRDIIKSGGTEPDAVICYANGIICMAKQECWDVDYMMEKIERLKDLISHENNRFVSLKRQKDEGKSVDEIMIDNRRALEVYGGLVRLGIRMKREKIGPEDISEYEA